MLVDPRALRELELHLVTRDLWLWPIASAPSPIGGARAAFQVRRRMLMARRGAWDDAATWVPVWIAFGAGWYDGAEPLPWAAHQALWQALEEYADHVRYKLGLGGIPRLDVPRERVG